MISAAAPAVASARFHDRGRASDMSQRYSAQSHASSARQTTRQYSCRSRPGSPAEPVPVPSGVPQVRLLGRRQPVCRSLGSLLKFSNRGDQPRRNEMRRVARWCVNHRLAAIAAWIVVLVVTVFISSSTGSHYANTTQLSGTPSATAKNLLHKASPGAAGDSEQIVVATRGASVTSPAVRAQIQPMLTKVAHLPDVASVTSPYSPAGSKQISRNGTVAFATVDFTKDANNISSSEATTLVNTARAPNSRTLQVEVLGDVAASTVAASQITTLVGVA